jgi:tRNA(Ile)-lysidine synthase
LLAAAFAELAAPAPRGADLMRALAALDRGETVTLSGLKLEGGEQWRLTIEQPRKG